MKAFAVVAALFGIASAQYIDSCKGIQLSVLAYEDANCTIEAPVLKDLYQKTFDGYDFDATCVAYPPHMSYSYICTDHGFVTQFYHGSTECPGDASQQSEYRWDMCTKHDNYYVKIGKKSGEVEL